MKTTVGSILFRGQPHASRNRTKQSHDFRSYFTGWNESTSSRLARSECYSKTIEYTRSYSEARSRSYLQSYCRTRNNKRVY